MFSSPWLWALLCLFRLIYMLKGALWLGECESYPFFPALSFWRLQRPPPPTPAPPPVLLRHVLLLTPAGSLGYCRQSLGWAVRSGGQPSSTPCNPWAPIPGAPTTTALTLTDTGPYPCEAYRKQW